MKIYEKQEQVLKNGTTRKLIITKSILVNENNEPILNENGQTIPFKDLKQLPSNIVYGSECVDVGYLENGPHYLNNISYEEVDKPIEEIEGE